MAVFVLNVFAVYIAFVINVVVSAVVIHFVYILDIDFLVLIVPVVLYFIEPEKWKSMSISASSDLN